MNTDTDTNVPEMTIRTWTVDRDNQDNYYADFESAAAAVFGRMVERACPHLDYYHSDLFHDANTVKLAVHKMAAEGGRLTMYHAVRSMGTNLVFDIDDVHQAKHTWRYDIATIRTAHVITVKLQISQLK